MVSFDASQSKKIAEEQSVLFELMEQLSQAYARQKISRSSYRRQRKALVEFREGKISRLPEFCFNELSQHQVRVNTTEADADRAHNPAPRVDGVPLMPAFVCLICGALVGLALILVLGNPG